MLGGGSSVGRVGGPRGGVRRRVEGGFAVAAGPPWKGAGRL